MNLLKAMGSLVVIGVMVIITLGVCMAYTVVYTLGRLIDAVREWNDAVH